MARSDAPRAPTSTYADAAHGELELRGALTPKTRTAYAALGGVREDAWQRAVEFLFERLAVRWSVGGVDYVRQKELLGRFRMASIEERGWVRRTLRTHLAEHFPEMDAP